MSAARRSSTISPPYMTMTRSAISSTVPRSWLMNSTAKPSSRRSSARRVRMPRWTTTSSPVVGSSSSTSLGRRARASARATRCFMPPDSSCGYARSTRRSRATSSSSSVARSVTSPGTLCAANVSANWACTRITGLSEFMLLWNTVDRSTQRSSRSFSSSAVVRSTPSKVTRPPVMRAGGESSRSTALPSVDLPQPDSPSSPTNSPSEMWNDTSCTARFAGWSRGCR